MASTDDTVIRPLVSLDIGGTLATIDGPTLSGLLVAASPLDATDARAIIRHLLHTAPALTEAVIAGACAALHLPVAAFPHQRQPTRARLLPGATTAVRALAAHTTVVTLSNVTCVEAEDDLTQALDPWISGYHPSSRTGYAKPDTAAFAAVATAHDTTVDDMIHVGDDWECDVLGALAAGARAVWVSRHRPIPDPSAVRRHGVGVAADVLAASRLILDQLTGPPPRR